MIVIVHKNDSVIKVNFVVSEDVSILDSFSNTYINETFFILAEMYPDENIIWCDSSLEDSVYFNNVEKCILSNVEMLSYHPSDTNIFNKVIDYTNFYSALINDIPTDVRFQTWTMSESIGIVNAKVINKFRGLKSKFSFQFTLNIMSQLGSKEGLLHYSEPSLYSGKTIVTKQESYVDTLEFIKIYQKRKWLLYICLLTLLKEPKKVFPVLSVLLSGTMTCQVDDFNDLYDELDTHNLQEEDEIDILIPTLGRKKYLKDVLEDLSKQTHLPKNVIIIEQHPDENVESELDYLNSKEWPFIIKHRFIHQLGACNARNIGLDLVESKWVFMADDDIRIEDNTIEDTLKYMLNTNIFAVSIGTYLPHQDKEKLGNQPYLWDGFSTCTSIINSQYAKTTKFDMAYEFGYGEDTAYGYELRRKGCMIAYTPKNALLHLKAPIGGFRFKFPHPWLNDKIQPKPSPTMMYLYESYMSEDQFFAYKIFLFIKQVMQKKAINIIKFKRKFDMQWKKSKYWAEEYRKGNR